MSFEGFACVKDLGLVRIFDYLLLKSSYTIFQRSRMEENTQITTDTASADKSKLENQAQPSQCPMSSPKSKPRFLKWFLITTGVCLLFVVTFYQMERQGFFDIQEVSISIKTTDSQKSYVKAYIEDLDAKLNKNRGTSLLRVSIGAISDQLKVQRWIKEYRISREWPSKLTVTIEPQRVALLLANNKSLSEGIVTPVSESGELLPKLDTRYVPAAPILRGDIFKKDLEKRKKAIELSRSLPAKGKLNSDLLSEIGYDQDGYWIQTINSDMKIKFGEDQFVKKSARVSQVLEYLEKKDLNARVIDANLSKKVLVRLRQNP